MPPAGRRSRSAPRTPRQVARIAAVSSLRTPARSASRGRTPQRATSAARSVSFSRTSTGSVYRGNKQGVLSSNARVTTRKLNRKTKKRKISKRGVLFKQKIGGATSSANTLYLGHNTAPVDVLIEQSWVALAKELMLHAQADISEIDGIIPVKVGDTITVVFQAHEGSVSDEDTLVMSGSETIRVIATWLNAAGRPWNNEATSTSDQVVFHSIQYSCGITDGARNFLTPAFLHLKWAKIQLSGSSTMKMQNRTVNVADDAEANAEDVDNVPLFCQVYEGHGSGMIYIKKPAFAGAAPIFTANGNTGVIGLEDGSSNNAPEFLPDPTQFDKVTKTSNFDYHPGEIRVSKLSWSRNMLFSTFFQMTHPHGAGVTYSVRKPIGEFRVFGFEKKIHFAASDTPLQSVYECEYDLATKFTFGRSYQSTTVFRELYDQNI